MRSTTRGMATSAGYKLHGCHPRTPLAVAVVADLCTGHTGTVPKSIKFGVIPALLLVVVVAIGYLAVSGEGGGGSPEAQVIESLIPGEQEATLQQGEVGIDLLTGWDASLTIDGVAIPESQLDKVEDLGIVTFTPGQGKAVEYWRAGQNCVTATYWQRATGPDQSFTRQWCFTAL